MERYFYLSLTPEALIASMLPPQEFGTYMAVGTKKKSRGQAIFFEVDSEAVKNTKMWAHVEKKCIANDKGDPKRSVYLMIYRALESISLKALKSLYLVTYDGRVLELKQGKYDLAETAGQLHLYQELGPVYSRIASSLPPSAFLKLLTDPSEFTSVPKLVFAEMELDALASDPEHGADDNLPYDNIDHLRDCLIELKAEPKKLKKTILRNVVGNIVYRTFCKGIFIGSGSEFLFYPYPDNETLNSMHHVWWRSANNVLLNK